MNLLTMPLEQYASVTMRMVTRSAETRSPYTGRQQVHVWPGGWWEADIEFMPIPDRDAAEDLIGWLAALDGRRNRFMLQHPVHWWPRGTMRDHLPRVDGGGQTGSTLVVGGVPAGTTMLRGDRFQVSHPPRLHMVTADTVADGSMRMALPIWPRLRVSPAHNESVWTWLPHATMMLADPVMEHTITAATTYGLRLRCVEDLR